MELTPQPSGPLQQIHRYGNGGFVVSDQHYAGSIIVTPERTYALEAANFSDLSVEDFQIFRGLEPVVDLLLIGCGSEMSQAPEAVQHFLKDSALPFEAMDTGAACRTYNVLLSEQRRVAAVLIAVD